MEDLQELHPAVYGNLMKLRSHAGSFEDLGLVFQVRRDMVWFCLWKAMRQRHESALARRVLRGFGPCVPGARRDTVLGYCQDVQQDV